jgi:hypothetical protein
MKNRGDQTKVYSGESIKFWGMNNFILGFKRLTVGLGRLEEWLKKVKSYDFGLEFNKIDKV